MRSDPQGLLHRRTLRISFFHKSNLRKIEINPSFWKRLRDRHLGTIAGGKKERLIAASIENVWQSMGFRPFRQTHRQKKTNVCVFVQRRTRRRTSSWILDEWRKGASSWKKWGSVHSDKRTNRFTELIYMMILILIIVTNNWVIAKRSNIIIVK